MLCVDILALFGLGVILTPVALTAVKYRKAIAAYIRSHWKLLVVYAACLVLASMLGVKVFNQMQIVAADMEDMVKTMSVK